MPETKPTQNPAGVVAGLVGAAGGWGMSRYVGSPLLIPAASAILLLIVFTKTAVRPRFFTGAIVLTGAHLAWFVAAGAFTGAWSLVGLDVLVFSAGLLWLWLRPGLWPALSLGLVQLVLLVVNVRALTLADLGSLEHRSLTLHCVLRLASLICLIYGYRRLRGEHPSAPSSGDEVSPAGNF